MASSGIPRTTRDMIARLRKMASGIEANLDDWPSTAPSAEQIITVADALENLQNALDNLYAQEATVRDQIADVMEDDAEVIFRQVRKVVRALFEGKEEQFGVKPRKARSRRPIPSRPMNLRANEISETEVELTWDAVADTDIYKVYASEDSVIDDEDFVNAVNKTTIVVKVKKGQQTWFSLRANNPAGDSEMSPIVSRTTY